MFCSRPDRLNQTIRIPCSMVARRGPARSTSRAAAALPAPAHPVEWTVYEARGLT